MIPAGSSSGLAVVSITQRYAGHVKQVGMAAMTGTAGAGLVGRYVIIVDDDIDPSDVDQVLWALTMRSDVGSSHDIGVVLEEEAGLGCKHVAQPIRAHVVRDEAKALTGHDPVLLPGWWHGAQLPPDQLVSETVVRQSEQIIRGIKLFLNGHGSSGSPRDSSARDRRRSRPFFNPPRYLVAR